MILPPDETLEACANVWYVIDDATKMVMLVGVRQYALTGTDEQKHAILRQLSATDFYAVEFQPLPESMVVVNPGTGQPLPGATTLQGAMEFTPILLSNIKPLPPQLTFVYGQPAMISVPPPENPLYVQTFIRQCEDGRLIAEVD